MTDPKERVKFYGQLARKVHQRLQELAAADTLAIMRTIPAARCHELTGDRTGELAVDISGNFRMVFEPKHDPIPKKGDSGLDWEKICRVQINDIEDYH